MIEEEEGVTVICPYCGKAIVVPAGYSRATYLCPRCKKPIPLDENIRELLAKMPHE